MVVDRTRTLTEEQCGRITGLAAVEQDDSGRQPLGEQARAALQRQGEGIAEHWLWHDPDLQAYACRFEGPVPTFELTADPASPAAAHSLLTGLKDELPQASIWAHGDRAQARIAAALLGLRMERELLLMRRELDQVPPSLPGPGGVLLRAFEPERDLPAWLDLNARAFAELPDQASVSEADLRAKISSSWFDATGFLVAESAGRMAGFHWTKVDPQARFDGVPSGEVYVLAVADEWRGTGLAQALLAAGLEHLAGCGLTTAHLYVDRTNERAVALYERAGFVHVDSDRLYRW